MNWTIARITELTKELNALDDEIKTAQTRNGSLKNRAMEMDKGDIAGEYQDRLDAYMLIRSAIDTVIEFLDGREVWI